jgi:hypothetical protein
VVSAKLARMNWEEPTLTVSELGGVTSRTLVMLGDDDEVTLEHAITMYRGLPDAELALVPGTSHALLHEKPALCNRIIVDFLTTDPVPTIAPVRRASTASGRARVPQARVDKGLRRRPILISTQRVPIGPRRGDRRRQATRQGDIVYIVDSGRRRADGQPAAAVASALNRTTSATGELTRDEILDNITLCWLTNPRSCSPTRFAPRFRCFAR